MDLENLHAERRYTVAQVRAHRYESPMTQLQPQAKLWIEIDGKIALSEWRVALLEAVEATGSLAKAAEHLGVPYRTASYKLREIEENLGVHLLPIRITRYTVAHERTNSTNPTHPAASA
jgi:hypothetical protein